jgi:transposase InsO family protein
MGKKEYWLKIRDEFSGYSWDYFMTEKSSTTTILKRQLQWMKPMGIRVKTVRCDNAKEQMAPLKDMCWSNGVLVEYVAPYAPQQNGKVERQFSNSFKESQCYVRNGTTECCTQDEVKEIGNSICLHHGKYINQGRQSTI